MEQATNQQRRHLCFRNTILNLDMPTKKGTLGSKGMHVVQSLGMVWY